MKVIVTGGAGFIGSAVVRLLIGDRDAEAVNLDKLTYAENLASAAAARRGVFRFHPISTDEVNGSLGPEGLFTQTTESGLRKIVAWCPENRSWWEDIRSGRYAGEGLGLAAKELAR
jgi:dTDP-glucose 4,6-dehydratase